MSLKALTSFISFLIVLQLLGCATIFASKKDTIKIESDPPGAEVSIEGEKFGETPVSIEVPRDTFGQKYVTLKKKGYKTRRVFLEKNIDKTAFFNLGFITTTSGATSWGIDALSGAMFEYKPGYYSIDLEKNNDNAELTEPVGPPSRDNLQLFVSKSFAKLKRDISIGGGEWLSAYVAIKQRQLSVSKERIIKAIEKQKAELIKSVNAMDLFKRLENIEV